MNRLDELKIREQEVEREWEWLEGLLYRVAKARCDQRDAHLISRLQHQSLLLGERRVALRSEIATLQGPSVMSVGGA